MAPDRRSTIDLPAPTAWPMIAAFGITLAWAGLVTNGLVTVVGVIATLCGAVGWFRDVLPVQPPGPVRVEPDPVIAPSPHGIAYVQVGAGPHRASLPVAIYPYSAGILGGIAGGLAMAVLASLYGL